MSEESQMLNFPPKFRGDLGRRYSSDLGRRGSLPFQKHVKPKFPPTVVVSNRLPFVLKRGPNGNWQRHSSAGGLVTAVAPVVADSGGLWVGWSGLFGKEAEEPIPEADPEDNTPTAGITSAQIFPVSLERDEFEYYYNGCCNGTFWPLFHSMPDRAAFKHEHYDAYVEVNNKFAEKVMSAVRLLKQRSDEDEEILVWIHDYHLMLAPSMIRELAEAEDIHIKLGFFLHIPFPPWDIFRIFPRSADILLGLLGCGMLGFHVEDYCKNFVDCCRRLLGCRVDSTHLLVEHGFRTVRVRPLPIGIPFKRFEQLALEAPRVMGGTQKVVLGVDRLDYTKGIVERVKAFELLFEKYPKYIGQVSLLQVAVPSRTDVKEYQDLKNELDQLIGRINGKFSSPSWSPIRYIFGSISQSQLAAFYRDSAVALVTPLRDGMNLVAKEYVACQVHDPGVLILSPFAGAGETMHEALTCNPYEKEDVCDALDRALSMSEDERVMRMMHLRRREEVNNVDFWLYSFLRGMELHNLEPTDDDGSDPLFMRSSNITPLIVDDFDYLTDFVGPERTLALLLDYDGTLAPIAPRPDLALLPPETKKVLERLSRLKDVFIAIITGRNVDDIKRLINLEGITYVGNDGLDIIYPDGQMYSYPVEDAQKEELKTIKEKLELLCPDGAYLEDKGPVVTLHYRLAPKSSHQKLIKEASQVIRDAGFLCVPAHCALEARPPVSWDKGTAVLHVLRAAFGMEWNSDLSVIFVGDDTIDEDAMRALKGMAVTYRIAASLVKTAADYRLPGPDSVLTLLKWAERHMGERKPAMSAEQYGSIKQHMIVHKEMRSVGPLRLINPGSSSSPPSSPRVVVGTPKRSPMFTSMPRNWSAGALE
ncbi:unnamed protein product [Notodromas monacha]|uniref:Trehalose-6-phosphate synthase n=1 Tax=Notodromas monacha TaxID=399045 RepID=A0A7R9BGJ3_9CRUS|nr:unnamed protein product [Notodromas monacha]CAG0913995.1 unnamed protein product [Notodromas monacha]